MARRQRAARSEPTLVDDVTVTVDAGRVTLALRIRRQVAVEA